MTSTRPLSDVTQFERADRHASVEIGCSGRQLSTASGSKNHRLGGQPEAQFAISAISRADRSAADMTRPADLRSRGVSDDAGRATSLPIINAADRTPQSR
jgi:hypothetical protein